MPLGGASHVESWHEVGRLPVPPQCSGFAGHIPWHCRWWSAPAGGAKGEDGLVIKTEAETLWATLGGKQTGSS